MNLFLSGLLSGALLISGCVVTTRGSLAGMFLLGAVVGGVFVLVSARLVTRLRDSLGDKARASMTPHGEPVRIRHTSSNIQRAPTPKPVSVIYAREKRQQQKQAQKVVESQKLSMLPLVQQEVLSALMNLGMSFKQAEQAVREAVSRKSGESFDELFRLAVGLGKTKKVAA